MSASREDSASSELALSRERMVELTGQVAELTAERLAGLSDQAAWKGASRNDLEPTIAGPPPETGTPPEEVVDRVTRDVLPYAARVDHPRFFAFVPSALRLARGHVHSP